VQSFDSLKPDQEFTGRFAFSVRVIKIQRLSLSQQRDLSIRLATTITTEEADANMSDFMDTKQNICDNTLDDAQLETRCPLDNGRHTNVPVPACYPVGQLDQLPVELLLSVLRCMDLPSLHGHHHGTLSL
jgi:hypothetical protein